MKVAFLSHMNPKEENFRRKYSTIRSSLGYMEAINLVDPDIEWYFPQEYVNEKKYKKEPKQGQDSHYVKWSPSINCADLDAEYDGDFDVMIIFTLACRVHKSDFEDMITMLNKYQHRAKRLVYIENDKELGEPQWGPYGFMASLVAGELDYIKEKLSAIIVSSPDVSYHKFITDNTGVPTVHFPVQGLQYPRLLNLRLTSYDFKMDRMMMLRRYHVWPELSKTVDIDLYETLYPPTREAKLQRELDQLNYNNIDLCRTMNFSLSALIERISEYKVYTSCTRPADRTTTKLYEAMIAKTICVLPNLGDLKLVPLADQVYDKYYRGTGLENISYDYLTGNGMAGAIETVSAMDKEEYKDTYDKIYRFYEEFNHPCGTIAEAASRRLLELVN